MNIALWRNPGGALTALGPFYRPMSLLDEIEELTREMWGSWRPGAFANTFVPRTEMYEEKGELVIKTELPGIKKEDLDVTLEGDTLTIKAEKKEEEAAEESTYHTRERYYGHYFRSTTLPFHVDSDRISATFKDGVLELRLPKAEEVDAKRIEVKAQLPKTEGKKRQRKPQVA